MTARAVAVSAMPQKWTERLPDVEHGSRVQLQAIVKSGAYIPDLTHMERRP